MSWIERLFGGNRGFFTAAAAGTAVGLAARAALDALYSGGKPARGAVGLIDPGVELDVETPHGPGLAFEVRLEPADRVPEGAVLTVRLRHNGEWIRSRIPALADNDGSFQFAKKPLLVEPGRLLAGALIPYAALPEDRPERLELAAVLLAGTTALAQDRFEVAVPKRRSAKRLKA